MIFDIQAAVGGEDEMKKKLKVLHVASFTGNIGDNANHRGAEYLRDCFLDYEFEITRKEIREFYWKEWVFNSDEFIREANRHDLVMIGGGNYFELWVKGSATGTSIDISIDTLKKIKSPILFYSLGCDPGQGAAQENIDRFRDFLDYTTGSGRYFISVRNDGALENIKSLYGSRYEGRISEIPDGGFFTYVRDIDHIEIEKDKTNILINIAGDMQETRFPGSCGKIDYNTFVKNFAELIEGINKEYKNNINFIFVPHIFRDIKSIYDILNEMSDKIRRKFTKVAPCLTGDKGNDYVFSLYKQSDLILGMRFHSNVCGLALNKNVIGLVNYIQIENLYKGISSKEYATVNEEGFQDKLQALIFEHLSNRDKHIEASGTIIEALKHKAEAEYHKLNGWLKTNFGGYEDEQRY